MIFRAGFALNTVGSFVNGLMPFRAFVAGFLMTTNFANPGNNEGTRFLEFFVANFLQATRMISLTSFRVTASAHASQQASE